MLYFDRLSFENKKFHLLMASIGKFRYEATRQMHAANNASMAPSSGKKEKRETLRLLVLPISASSAQSVQHPPLPRIVTHLTEIIYLSDVDCAPSRSLFDWPIYNAGQTASHPGQPAMTLVNPKGQQKVADAIAKSIYM
jgi:hypothetical protein